MVKYLIFGNGFLGNKFREYFNNLGEKEEYAIIGQRRINSIKDIYFELAEYEPEIIINCIGKTGGPPYNNVDWCESHKEETFFSNVTVPTLLAEVCEEYSIYMVHIGSGCIFEGDNEGKGWSEDDKPNFFGSFYSKTKIYSEQILKTYKNVLQLRIRMPIDNRPGHRNLIDKLIRYEKVIGDIPNSVTCIPDLMIAANALINSKKIGIYNVVQHGAITHKRILEIYKEIVNSNFVMPEFIQLEELKKLTIAGRSNCVLDTLKLIGKGTRMRNVEEAVEYCFEGYKKWIV